MSFPQQPVVTRNPHIREIKIILFRTADIEDPEGPQSTSFRIVVDDQVDEFMSLLQGDLIPHAPPIIVTALQDIMDWAWAKAEDEVIP